MNRLLSILISLFIFNVAASEYLPSVIYQLDSKFSHHVVVVEKSTHSLFLYQYDKDSPFPRLVKKYQIATGKIIGNKQLQGDHKTPEGIYFFQHFHSSAELLEKYGETGLIYGAGAFTMNYPNIFDRREGKTGGGIWLHSTDDDKRVSKGLDSRGCVVAIDRDLKDISRYIDLKNTPAIIVQNLNFLTRETWSLNKKNLMEFIHTWQTAWQEKDFKTYIDSYSKSDFMNRKGGFENYKRYKRAVFARRDRPVIKFNHTNALVSKSYAIVTLEQDYSSDIINDLGKKTLYLKKDANYQWKIIHEGFEKLNRSEANMAFTPSLRFFEELGPKEIANDSGSI